jgi:hypothetical protein
LTSPVELDSPAERPALPCLTDGFAAATVVYWV